MKNVSWVSNKKSSVKSNVCAVVRAEVRLQGHEVSGKVEEVGTGGEGNSFRALGCEVREG